MRSLLFTLVLLTSFVPFVAEAQFDGPIIPAECTCEGLAPAYGCVLQTIQNIIRFGISIAFIFATLALVYAGFTWMTSGGNAERRSQGKTLLMNVAVGIAVMLSAWLLVDFIMKTLYREPTEFGPWNSILSGSGESSNRCLISRDPSVITDGDVEIVLGPLGDGSSITPRTDPLPGADNQFTYQSGIQAQLAHASPQLRQLLSCMSARVPANVGQISSISGKDIVNGTHSFQYCAANGSRGGCAHTAHSCHFGGRTCVGSSYAADFGDEQNGAAIIAAARGCGARTLDEGDHIHVSIGAANGCGCEL